MRQGASRCTLFGLQIADELSAYDPSPKLVPLSWESGVTEEGHLTGKPFPKLALKQITLVG